MGDFKITNGLLRDLSDAVAAAQSSAEAGGRASFRNSPALTPMEEDRPLPEAQDAVREPGPPPA